MPRKSAAALSIVKHPGLTRRRLAPSEGAPEEVRRIFAEILAAAPANHFRDADGHLIEQYAQAIALARQAYAELAVRGPVVDGRASAWVSVLEKAHRSSVALAARLRLSPQHRADSRSAGRNAGPPPSAYDLMGDDDDA